MPQHFTWQPIESGTIYRLILPKSRHDQRGGSAITNDVT